MRNVESEFKSLLSNLRKPRTWFVRTCRS